MSAGWVAPVWWSVAAVPAARAGAAGGDGGAGYGGGPRGAVPRRLPVPWRDEGPSFPSVGRGAPPLSPFSPLRLRLAGSARRRGSGRRSAATGRWAPRRHEHPRRAAGPTWGCERPCRRGGAVPVVMVFAQRRYAVKGSPPPSRVCGDTAPSRAAAEGTCASVSVATNPTAGADQRRPRCDQLPRIRRSAWCPLCGRESTSRPRPRRSAAWMASRSPVPPLSSLPGASPARPPTPAQAESQGKRPPGGRLRRSARCPLCGWRKA